ncbi:DUF5753 domain-containing protein [Streptomyces olivaceus]|uniref:DUF5753 domain-containing protein n=1 Tax=Streptomyces olivaceus TaxID=47716 RepID=UPI001884E9F3|nr:DUF5753 domain-containing protein [Streptomyces olivaceus]MBZ6255682.1 DUF5753 domain-containing protein [Streptomyces olivaceus]
MTRTTQLGNRTSTVLGRRLGAELLRLRDAAARTQQQAADVITATNSKIVKMERGWVPMRDPDIRALCEFYGLADAEAMTHLLELARLDRERRKAKGWWQDSPHPGSLTEFIAMEDAASRVRTWQPSLVPGLFQTPEYARSLAVSEAVGPWEDPAEIERVVDIRMRRQGRLVGARPLEVYAVVWEAALRQLIGGAPIMRGQLEHLLEVAALENVRLQVLPFHAGGHPCITGPFTILSFNATESMDVVQADTIACSVWVENEAAGSEYGGLFERTARCSLAQRDSIRLIETIRQEI